MKSRGVLRSAGPIVATAVATGLVWIRKRPFGVTVQGQSMVPTLLDGDRCLAIQNSPIREGDLVIARHPLYPGVEMVKRVRGADPDGMWWLEGDTTDGSLDSRALGPFPTASIAGRVIAVFGPSSRVRVIRRVPSAPSKSG